MPWKGEKNPYLIWLSEIILQQTRVEQGWKYYERFKKQYPTIIDLANAPEDEVMKMWEGLGYYSRARNLHSTAQFVAQTNDGVFPSTYKDVLALKGVGPYTAAAICSFAYNLPYAVVDGNVYRFLSRYFGISTPIDSTEGKKQFAILAQELLDKKEPGIYNQAIIDFGASVCKPKNPNCKTCPFNEACKAYAEQLVANYPVKTKKIKKKTRYFNFLILEFEGKQWIQKRLKKDIWRNLYSFPLIESDQLLTLEQIFESNFWTSFTPKKNARLVSKKGPFKQQLTHQTIIANFWKFKLSQAFTISEENAIAISSNSISKYAFPQIIDLYLKDNSLYLELL